MITHSLSNRRNLRVSAALVALACLAAFPVEAPRAQGTTSRPVVQPLPAQDTQRLNRALVELAKTPNSVPKLLEAGNAALAVGDLDAALGFFKRLTTEEPESEEGTLGLARVYLRSGRPVRALLYFDAAQSRGAGRLALGADHALTYDMLGDHSTAQSKYLDLVEASPKDDEARRRMAISFAITGKRAAFEASLRPLVDRRDFAAFRARTFGLAIMGEQERAAAIADAVMPRTLAQKITPYLAFMPRLTSAQQAAAANLGVFPRAADIGRDSPGVAAYRRNNLGETVPPPVAAENAEVDTRLAPAGTPLGEAPAIVAQSSPTPTASAPAPGLVTEIVTPRAADPAIEAQAPLELATPSVPADEALATRDPELEPQPANLADAFGDILSAETQERASAASAGAVDLATIEAPREIAEPPAPTPPAHPSRIWVQVATGRDLEALGFDWRRLSRKASDALAPFGPHTVEWGQANRLLAGPLDSLQDARDLINALSRKGIDSFRYTSPEGTAIQELTAP